MTAPSPQCQPSIVGQLRAHAGFVENGGCAEHSMTDEPWLLREAADRIEYLEATEANQIASLKARIEELEAALREIDGIAVGKKFGAARDMQRVARAALPKQEPGT